ncbi:MAG: hypothetical protein Kow0069_19580 [Promethearchaeota archaeon]
MRNPGTSGGAARGGTSLSKKYARPKGKKGGRGSGRGRGESEDAGRGEASPNVRGKREAGPPKCLVGDCPRASERSLSKVKYEKVLAQLGWKLKDDKARRLHVCAAHYKDLKKRYKKDAKVQRHLLRDDRSTRTRKYNY